jgi:hypothetical protein
MLEAVALLAQLVDWLQSFSDPVPRCVGAAAVCVEDMPPLDKDTLGGIWHSISEEVGYRSWPWTSTALMAEITSRWLIRRWARKIEVEIDMDADDDTVWDAAQKQTTDDLQGFRRHGAHLTTDRSMAAPLS